MSIIKDVIIIILGIAVLVLYQAEPRTKPIGFQPETQQLKEVKVIGFTCEKGKAWVMFYNRTKYKHYIPGRKGKIYSC